MIKFKNASMLYADGTKAADNLDITINRSEFCALIGPSGSGKSTFMSMINGLVTPSSGEIYFDGEALNTQNLKRYQQRVSMIHQQLHLVPRLSVLHNVLSGKLHEIPTLSSLFKHFNQQDQRRACKLLEQVGLEEKHMHRRASELSGGQQQRVAIARAFMGSPEVVLADEPVASLDPVISHSVLRGLKETSSSHQSTVICSLHQVDFATEFADRVIALRKGQVVFDGSPAEITEEILAEIYQEEAIPRSEAVVEIETDQVLLQPAVA